MKHEEILSKKRALTDDIDDRDVYMRRIQASYRYEDQEEYDIRKL